VAALVEASPVAIVGHDLEGRVELWSTAAEALFGWTAAEALAGPVPPLSAEQLADACEHARAGRSVAGVRLRCRRKDGQPIEVSLSSAPVRGGASRAPAGAVVMFQDVTAAHDIEQRFLEAQRLDLVDRIAGAIAHDLRNVLAAIKGFAVVAGEGMPPQDPGRADMDQILKAAERGAALAHKLLAFTRNTVVQPSVLDLNAVVDGMEKTLRRLVGMDIELVLRLAPDLVPVRADAAQIEQVIVNLVLNARDAMPGGGRLVVETTNMDLGELEAHARGIAAGRYARVTVADTGGGMPPETRARIFEPFFTTKASEGAQGLGLPATLAVVKKLGGYVGARSQPGLGTTFTIDLPETTEPLPVTSAAAHAGALPPGAAVAAAAAVVKARAGATILVVEDDDLVRMLTVKVLRRHGYLVLDASNATDALARAAAHPGAIQLLLSDVGLPQTSGPELAAQLAPRRPETKVLYMSGYGRSALMERGLEPGFGVLEKPFTPDALLDRIRAILEGEHIPAP
jgi:PAS domain S-box-containing protein